MKRTNLTWQLTGLAGIVSMAVMLAGFAWAVISLVHPAGAEPADQQAVSTSAPMSAPGEAQGIHILALGDSLTLGIGDEKGEGYAGKVKNLLRQESKQEVYVWNMAVSGAKTTDLLNELESSTLLSYAEQADIILFTIGGNDLNQWAMPSADGTEDLQMNYEEARQHLPEASARLKRIMAILEQHAPKARIVYVGLYHPYPDNDPDRIGGYIIQQWNAESEQLANAYPNMVVVPIYDFFQTKWSEYLFADHYHPNGAGYAEIAARVMQVIR
ncbi:GDSL-type esterase/lipase family protein [Cohnella sp. AR92]|uniref:GDSL-type esterase/lipase family protein n=1 Tax=Cohnella sp. AR92 TaxID=648716 RepID=UPI000F8C644D|nr:GDSL-type esterase/lipase family protein [Cohnella sp. AR92]RUS47040.1 hypothetical protein ELR57_11600 [Cohnella sp. AR92]